ncbi:FkbM family methyltransferase [Massilioclostridium coli]|uniref:FkbM family methyltransferase n=1 Tax=Massilioclostridium coli TaxID=1870991 RepID=UPI0022E39F56|nr:FkbM family methyltransferase [Massilioclostridium coli]
MLEKIKEQNVWDCLQQTNLPVVMYGMGDGALKIFKVFEQYGIQVEAMFASDEFVRGHSFQGYLVQKYSDICRQYPEFHTVMAFAIHDDPTLERLFQMNQEHPIVAPDVPVAGDGLFTREYIAEHEAEFDQVYDLLADETSKKTYLDILNFKVSGKIEYLYQCRSEKPEVYTNLLKPNDQEIFVDLGAYDGDTIAEFLQFVSDYQHIYALEPDAKNFKKLEKNTVHLERITRYNMAAWNQTDTLYFSKKAGRNSRLSNKGVEIPADSVDHLIQQPVSILKMDIEGTESKALEGAKKTIQQYRPKLYVCAYHRNEDLFALPLQIMDLCPDYKIYLRHHPYIPAWETNFYCIPK